jgi:hypothetical protein
MPKINSIDFYNNWKGHLIEHLTKMIDEKSFIERLRSYNGKNRDRKVIFLAGDSSLDNKHWPLSNSNEKKLCNKPPINGYEDVLEGNNCVPDVAYQINQTLIDNGLNEEYVCINTSIEATTLHERFTEPNSYNGDVILLDQDKFIFDYIRTDDILIVSVGGNDIALSPLPETTRHFQNFIKNSRKSEDEKNKDEINSYEQYFTNIFNNKITLYIEKLCSRDGNNSLPSVIIPCMIYYPALTSTQSGFAEGILIATNYRTGKQEILENFIKDLYLKSTRHIHITKKGEQKNIIDPCPLYEVLDNSNDKLYLTSVEPSIEGGKLMAIRFVDQIKIYKYIRSYFRDVRSIEYNMIYFIASFNEEHRKNFKILINQLLNESNKINHSKKDKYYHNKLKQYINIILKDGKHDGWDIDLLIYNEFPTLYLAL